MSGNIVWDDNAADEGIAWDAEPAAKADPAISVGKGVEYAPVGLGDTFTLRQAQSVAAQNDPDTADAVNRDILAEKGFAAASRDARGDMAVRKAKAKEKTDAAKPALDAANEKARKGEGIKERSLTDGLQDLGIAGKQGLHNINAGVSWGLDQIPGVDTSGFTASQLEESKLLESEKSDYAQAANKSVSDAEGFVDTMATLLDNPAAIGDVIAQNASFALPGLAAGSAGAKVGGAMAARKAAQVGATEEATAAAVMGARATGATVGGMSGEAATSGAMSGAQVEADILAMPFADLEQKSARFRELSTMKSPEAAREQLADEVSLATAALTGGATLAGGFVANKINKLVGLGDPYAGALVRQVTAKGALKNTVGETTQEMLQSPAEQIAGNVANVDDNQSLTEGVGKSIAMGAVGAVGQSGAMNAAGYAMNGGKAVGPAGGMTPIDAAPQVDDAPMASAAPVVQGLTPNADAVRQSAFDQAMGGKPMTEAELLAEGEALTTRANEAAVLAEEARAIGDAELAVQLDAEAAVSAEGAAAVEQTLKTKYTGLTGIANRHNDRIATLSLSQAEVDAGQIDAGNRMELGLDQLQDNEELQPVAAPDSNMPPSEEAAVQDSAIQPEPEDAAPNAAFDPAQPITDFANAKEQDLRRRMQYLAGAIKVSKDNESLKAERQSVEKAIDRLSSGKTAVPPAPVVSAQTVPAPAPAEASPIAGDKIDAEWTSFAPESGTLSIPRAEMPQIKAEHRGAMVNFLKARGISSDERVVKAASLKPTQAEFSPGKVEKAKGFTGGDRSILVSSDNHILDGHHQWLAKFDAGKNVKVIRLGAPIKNLLSEVAEFPSATTDTSTADDAPVADTSPVIPSDKRDGEGLPPETEQQKSVRIARMRADGQLSSNERDAKEAKSKALTAARDAGMTSDEISAIEAVAENNAESMAEFWSIGATLLNEAVADRQANGGEARGGDRRQADAPVANEQRQGPRRVSEMTPEEMQKALLINPLTDLPNKRAFEEDADLGWEHVAAMDIDGFGFLNDIWGHDPVDAILKQIGAKMADFSTDTVRLYHRSGDEFAARSNDRDALQLVLKSLQEHLEASTFMVPGVDTDGNPLKLVKRGIGVTYGISTDYQRADNEANADKERRLASGDRGAKGSNPGGMVEVDAQGVQTDLGPRGVSRQETERLRDRGSQGGVSPDTEQEAANRREDQRAARSRAMRERNAAAAIVNPDADDLLAAVAKLGGISRKDAKEQGIDPADFDRRGHGIKRVFTSTGKSMDGMAEALHELGYPVVDEQGRYSANKMLDVLSDASGGKKIYTPNGASSAMDRESIQQALENGDTEALPPSEAGEEFTQAESVVAASLNDVLVAGFDIEAVYAMVGDNADEADINRIFNGLVTGETGYVQQYEAKRSSIRSSSSDYQEAVQGRSEGVPRNATGSASEYGEGGLQVWGEEDIPGFGQGQDASDLTDDEVARHLNGESLVQIRASRSEDFSLETQSEADLAAKEAREQDSAAAEEADRTRQIDASSDNFTMSTGIGTAGEQVRPAVRGGGRDMFASRPKTKIVDFGEKIGGARKDMWLSFTTAIDDELPSDYSKITLSKYFPEPDYKQLIEGGADVSVLAAIKAIRDQIPSKPRRSYKLTQWVDNLNEVRNLSSKLMAGSLTLTELRSKMLGSSSRALADFVGKIDIYTGVGYPAFLKADKADLRWGTHFTYAKDADGKDIAATHKNKHGVFYDGRRVSDSFFGEKNEAIAELKAFLEGLSDTPKNAKETSLDLYRATDTGKVFIGKKVGTNKFIDLKSFDSAKEARAYLAEHKDELIEQLNKIREQQNNIPTRRSTNDPRRGTDYRLGENVTPEAFGKAFGFRGVEFGNWVEQGRRQQDLNNAHDALRDLANIINILPRAVSLNGTLGLAFGARGKSGASAHYESDKIVINLTKKEGAGSLGHEWWHAMDNYFSRMRTLAAEMLTERPHELKEQGIRPEVIDAFGKLMKAIKASPMTQRSIRLDKQRPKDYWSTPAELSARAFEAYLVNKSKAKGESSDYLVNLIDPDTAKTVFESGTEDWPYPFDNEMADITKAFDNLFGVLKVRDEDGKAILYSRAGNAWYYSPLTRAVEGIKQETALASQWRAMIEKAPGVKPDELAATGVLDYLQAVGGKVKKSDLLDYLSDNAVTVQDVMRTSPQMAVSEAEAIAAKYDYTIDEEYGETAFLNEDGESVDFDDLPQQMQDDLAKSSSGLVKYEKYTLPGGKNYRELLITLPSGNDGNYKSSHWDEKNILAHVRFDERTDADGKKVLFINEIQSDWGQEGKKKGFAPKDSRAPTDDEVREFFGLRNGADPADYRDEMVEMLASRRVPEGRPIPNAPFVTKTDAWVSLAIKRMIRHAAENGFDRIAFVNGQQSADLYDLSKQIDSVKATKTMQGAYAVQGRGIDGKIVSDDVYIAERLPDVVGKELADKIVAQGDGSKEYRGIDLKVGGEGMKTFYDKIVPKVAGDVIKKLGGGKVQAIKLGNREELLAQAQEARADGMHDGAAEIESDANNSVGMQLGFDISPAMKEAAMAGLPLFARQNSGTGLASEKVESLIAPIIAKWKNGPRVSVVQSASDLPGGSAPHDVEGAYSSNGIVYLVADNLPTEQRLMEVLAHESIGHAAMESMLGKELMAELTREIQAWERRGSQFFVNLGKAVDESQPGLPADRRAKEIVALMAERGLHKQGGLWKRVTGAIRAFLRDMGFSGKWLASLTDADMFKMLADAERYLEDGRSQSGKRNAETALAFSRKGNFGSDRASWPDDFPRVVFAAQLGAAEKHPDYLAAKAGNINAAVRLVGDLVPDAKIDAIRAALGGRKPVIVPVAAEEAAGNNKIPLAYAEYIASRLGLKTEPGIVQSARAKRTGKGSDYRLGVQSAFDGKVTAGQSYLIVDDTMTMGGTLANLRGHIEANGGNVILASALTGFGQDGVLALTKPMRDAVWAKHGSALDDYLKRELGYGIDQLTQGEAGHFRKAVSLDAIRDRIIAARNAAGLGRDEEAVSPGQVTPDKPLFSKTTNKDLRAPVAEAAAGGRLSGIGTAIADLMPGPNRHNDSDYHEENRRLREEDKTAWRKGSTLFRKYLFSGGLLPDGVFDEKIQRDNAFSAIEFDVKHLTGRLTSVIQKDYGKDLGKLLPADKAKIAAAMAGRVDPTIPLETRSVLIAMRKYIDALSGEYTGYLAEKVATRLETDSNYDPESDADARLIQTITGNMGTYVHRSYRAFDDADWFKNIPDGVIDAARQYLISRHREDGMGAAEASRRAEVAIHEIVKSGTAYESMDAFVAEGKLGAKDLSVLIKRKEIAPEIRALLGEYTDPRLNFAKSATKMSRLIWNQRFLDRVREMGVGTFLFDADTKPANATVQIAGDASEVYAPLNGLWTTPEVAQAFKDALGKEQMSDLMRHIVGFNAMVKYGKTVLSPTTAMRNIQSALFFPIANGHFQMKYMSKAIVAFQEQVIGGTRAQGLAYMRRMKELGVTYDTPNMDEIVKWTKESKHFMLNEDAGSFRKGLNTLNERVQGFYRFGDDFWKIIGFENEKAIFLKAGYPLAEAEQQAADRIRNTYPTYSMISSGVKSLSRFPLVGTFVSFPAEIIRTSGHMFKYMAQDLRSDNKQLRIMGARRALGMAMVSAGFYALSAITRNAFDVDDDDEEAIRVLAAPWQKNSTYLYWGRDEQGNMVYTDLSFLDPYGYWKRPLTALMRDQPWDEALVSGLKDMLSPFFGTDITTAAVLAIVSNKKDSGGVVYDDTSDGLTQLQQATAFLGKSLAPGFVGNAERLLAANAKEKKSSGQAYSMKDEMLALVGWRNSTVDPKQAVRYRAMEYLDDNRKASAALNRVLKQQNTVSDDEIIRAVKGSIEAKRRIYKDMASVVWAAKKSGMDEADAEDALRNGGVGKGASEAIAFGDPIEVEVSIISRDKAIKAAVDADDFARADEIERRYDVAEQVLYDLQAVIEGTDTEVEDD